jgi:hypothetical protein
MTQVGTDQIGLAVDELGGQAKLVERLVPELLLRPRAEDPVTDPGQRGRDHQRPDQAGPLAGDGLGDPAADVIAGQHRPAEPELLDQRDDAARLRGRGVLTARLGLVPVRLAEPPQIRHNDLRRVREPRHHGAVVGPVARPAVQQQHGGATTGPVIGEAEAIHGIALWHTAEYPATSSPPPGGIPGRYRCQVGPI